MSCSICGTNIEKVKIRKAHNQYVMYKRHYENIAAQLTMAHYYVNIPDPDFKERSDALEIYQHFLSDLMTLTEADFLNEN